MTATNTSEKSTAFQEIMQLIELLSRLPPDKQKEFLYMLKGAAIVSEKCA